MGGEKRPGAGYAYNDRGSPPRGRGKEIMVTLQDINARITPAWAGKRAVAPFPVARSRDHPRVGGEKGHALKKRLFPGGSPPRGRGKGEIESYADECDRITPAWAGKSTTPRRQTPPFRDHPRVGGEKPLCKAGCGPQKGSPPRGRGKVILHPMHCPHGRITPAWAGKRRN